MYYYLFIIEKDEVKKKDYVELLMGCLCDIKKYLIEKKLNIDIFVKVLNKKSSMYIFYKIKKYFEVDEKYNNIVNTNNYIIINKFVNAKFLIKKHNRFIVDKVVDKHNNVDNSDIVIVNPSFNPILAILAEYFIY
jgi:hypothetical protein